MEIRKTSGLLGCACLLALALFSGCGGSSSSNSIPSTATIYYAHSVVFNNTSTMAMGYNAFGQLGVADRNTHDSATRVSIGPVNGVSTGGDHTLAFAFTNLSSVYTWGSNYYGQLGNSTIATTGSSAYSSTPVRVPLHGTNNIPLVTGQVTDVSAGWFHSLAVVDGTVFGWGYNGYGQLGDRGEATLTTSIIPKQVQFNGGNLNNVVKVAAGGAHSLALTSAGQVYAWGDNTYGELGTNPTNLHNTYSSTPLLVNGADGLPLSGITQITAAGSNSYALQGGTVLAWGYNGMGQLGLDPTLPVNTFKFTPQVIQLKHADGTAATALSISAGLDHVLALLDDHTVVGWGLNEYSQLGDNSTTNRFTPVAVRKDGTASNLLTGVTAIIAFGNHSLAKVGTNPGVWYGWGDNGYGQLGRPISSDSIGYLLIPAVVKGY